MIAVTIQINWTPYFFEDILQLKDTWLILTIILATIFIIIMLLLVFLRQRICIAIALIQQGSKAVGQMYSTLFFPVIPFLLQLVSTCWILSTVSPLSSRLLLSGSCWCPCSWYPPVTRSTGWSCTRTRTVQHTQAVSTRA